MLQPKDTRLLPEESCLTNHMDRGGLLYPSQALKDLVAAMEDAFTHCFSFNKLKADRIMDLISCLSINKLNMVGCAQHSVEITNQVIRLFCHHEVALPCRRRECIQEREARKNEVPQVEAHNLTAFITAMPTRSVCVYI